jgi:hypothetical protein
MGSPMKPDRLPGVLFFCSFLLLPTIGLSQSPSITGISPLSGPTGTVLTVSGANLGGVTSATVNGQPATVESAATDHAVLIVASVPGKGVVTVTSGTDAASSVDTFTVTPTGIRFVPNIDSAATKILATGDFDGDGHDDIVGLVHLHNNNIVHRDLAARMSAGGGTVGGIVLTNIGDARLDSDPSALAIADFDRDGRADVVCAMARTQNGGGMSVVFTVLLSDSAKGGAFRGVWRNSPVAIKNLIPHVVTGDLNGDGYPDFACAVSGQAEDQLLIFLNDPGNPGTFRNVLTSVSLPKISDFGMSRISAASPVPDIFVATASGIDWFQNSGDGTTFTRHPDAALVPGTIHVTTGDVDGDGAMDLVCLNGNGTVTVALGNNTGGFTATGIFSDGSSHSRILAADLDGDGAAEIAIDEPGVHRACALLKIGTGSGSIEISSVAIGDDCDDSDPSVMAIGDLDGDGHPDLVLSACTTVTEHRGFMTGFSPSSGPAGTVVTVTGVHLLGTTSVRIGSVPGTIKSVTDTSVVFNAKNSGHAGEKIELNWETLECKSSIQPFTATGNTLSALPAIQSSSQLQVAIGDVDGDGFGDQIVLFKRKSLDDRYLLGLLTRLSHPGAPPTDVVTTIGIIDSADNPPEMAVGDLNGDGRADVVVAHSSGGGGGSGGMLASKSFVVDVCRSDSSSPGSFERQDQFAKATGRSAHVSIGDLDGDGLPDIAVSISSASSDSLYAWPNDPAQPGNFRTSRPALVWSPRSNLRISSIEGTPKTPSAAPELVAATDSGIVAFKDNSGVYTPSASYNPSTRIAAVASGDVNGDGIPDIVCIETDSAYITTFLGTGDGFTQGQRQGELGSGAFGTVFRGGWLSRLAVADLDGDGLADIAIDEPGVHFAGTIFRSDTTGGRAKLTRGDVDDDCDDSSDRLLATGDLDGDGIPDIAFTSCSSSVISPPMITGVSPLIGPPGTILTVTGLDFSSSPSIELKKTNFAILLSGDTTCRLWISPSQGPTSGGALRLSSGGGFCGTTDHFIVSRNLVLNIPRIDTSADRIVLTGDLDGDGTPDMVQGIVHRDVASRNLLVAASRGTGGGHFDPPVVRSFPLGPDDGLPPPPSLSERCITLGDVDGDGKLEVIVSHTCPDGTCASEADALSCDWSPTGSLALKTVLFRRMNQKAEDARVAVGDVNGDGHSDVVCTFSGTGGDSVEIIHGDGTLNFLKTIPIRWSAPEVIARVMVHKIHRGDHQPNRVFVQTSSYIHMLDDGLTEIASVHPTDPITDFTLADFNLDSLEDIALFSASTGSFTVYKQLQSAASNPLYEEERGGNNPLFESNNRIAAGDVDGDGIPDCILRRSAGDHQHHFINLRTVSAGQPAVVEAYEVQIDTGATSLMSADLDGDAFTDFIASGSGTSPAQQTLAVSPGSVDFGQVAIGDSADATLTVSNIGSGSLVVETPLVQGPDSASFLVWSPRSNVVLDANQSVPVVLRLRANPKLPGLAAFVHISSNGGTVDIPLQASVADTAMFRSFSTDSILTSVGDKGKPMTSIKPHPNVVRFVGRFPADSASTGLYIDFASAIDTTFPFTVSPPASGWSFDPKLKKSHITFGSAASQGTVYVVGGMATASKPIKAKFVFERGGIAISKKKIDATFTENAPMGRKPNRINDLETVLKNIGLLVGRSVPDSSKYLGWLYAKKSGDVLKSYFEKGDKPTQADRAFDYFANGRPIVKQQSSLPVSKFGSRLLADLLSLKIGIYSSAGGLTPPGFGELIYADTGSNPLNGLTVAGISAYADTLMTGHYSSILKTRVFADSATFHNLGETVRRINGAFEGPLDTAGFLAGLKWKPVRSVNDVPFLHRNLSAAPVTIAMKTGPSVPSAYVLRQNYPNPFNPSTSINFELPVTSIVTIRIYNILGQEVTSILRDELLQEGEYSETFDAALHGGLSSGVYFCSMTAKPLDDAGVTAGTAFSAVKKMMLIK